MDLAATYLPICIGWEGAIRTMYLDTLGYVTVGDGMMLPDAVTACKLPFYCGDRLATSSEITADYTRVRMMAKGLRASSYALESSPRLSADSITEQLQAIITSRIADLTRMLSCFAVLPFTWKLALLDLAYNIGSYGLMHEFPHLIDAVEHGNAAMCVIQCYRPQVSAARNNWTRMQFSTGVAGNQATATMFSAAT